MSLNKEITLKEMLLRDASEHHAPYTPEFDFYYAVKSGDVERVTELCKTEFAEKSGLGKLSEDPLQSMKYHFAITAAMLARYAIDAGLEHESAYGISDLYIQKCDRANTLSELSKLHREMSLDFVKRTSALRKSRIISKQVILCVNYIYENLHKRITVNDLAKHTGLNPSYLSRLFRNETGATVTEYVLSKKITAAKSMLKYTDHPISAIAETLAFSSQSHFTKTFRAAEGITPKKYRDLYSFSSELSSIDNGQLTMDN